MSISSGNTEPVGRREQNKIDTRRAIADAAFDLARSVGPGAFTADQIAERAGVSRRTFFNYFHSAEDALTTRMDSFLELAIANFTLVSEGEPLFDSIIRAFSETTRMEGMSLHGELFRMAEGNPDLLRAQLHAWERAETRIVDTLRQRLGAAASDLYLTALAGSILACAKAAMRDWASSIPDVRPDRTTRAEGATGDRTDDASDSPTGADLENCILESLTMLRDGFADPAAAPPRPAPIT